MQFSQDVKFVFTSDTMLCITVCISTQNQAAWFGFPRCVRMLLAHGADPEVPHRKNGCTPLHLAHFCTIDDTHPGGTIEALRNAGACVNNRGGVKCGKRAIDHAIQVRNNRVVE